MEEHVVHRNEVMLVGRVSRAPVCKELPSGDRVTSWGLAVRRPPGHPSNKKSDGIACVAFGSEVAAVVTQFGVDDVVSVEGALHHRFWNQPEGGSSTYEVEVHRVRRLSDSISES
ncbi:single-stranded DNA-binding protein [Sphaerisporangium sp. NPDC051017]|uniref:single-stranded DNA-binding protein n=1 Tax=unclassified Sphaerisporangium TaxID=2630420 RepID=UPI0033DBA509